MKIFYWKNIDFVKVVSVRFGVGRSPDTGAELTYSGRRDKASAH